ncbi:MAG: F0F1 ATP synthase subunit A [Stackebrandtia sp.]
MLGQATTLAAGAAFPPGVEDFYLPDLFGNEDGVWLTKITLLVWIAVAAIIVFFLVTYRNPQLVPTKKQWFAESVYGFVRNNIADELLGKEGLRFAPYLASLFCFILLTNLFGIIPFVQMSPNSHIAFPATLAVISYVLFNYIGIRRHGFVKYMKHTLVPPAPWFVMPLLIPLEFFSTLLVRPFTLALRLFANMFAGHIILLVFTLGGFAVMNANMLFFPVTLVSWLLAIALTLLEAFIAIMQAYIFTILTASYVQGALAEGH